MPFLLSFSAKLHTWLRVFLQEVTYIDRQSLKFFVKRLSRSQAECFAGPSYIAVMTLERFGYDSALVAFQQIVQSFRGAFIEAFAILWTDSGTNICRPDVPIIIRIKDQPLNFSCQLSNVARPGIGLENLNRFHGDS